VRDGLHKIDLVHIALHQHRAPLLSQPVERISERVDAMFQPPPARSVVVKGVLIRTSNIRIFGLELSVVRFEPGTAPCQLLLALCVAGHTNR